MSLTVNPITNTYYTDSIYGYGGYSNNTGPSSVTSAYDQILALNEAEDALIAGTSSTNGLSSGSGSGIESAFLLDLSPAALNALNGVGATSGVGTTTTINLTGTSSASGTSITGTTTTTADLTPVQTAEVNAIVAQFSGQSATPATFEAIAQALTAAGINPQEVSIAQLLAGYNYAYSPGLSFNDSVFTDTLASELVDA